MTACRIATVLPRIEDAVKELASEMTGAQKGISALACDCGFHRTAMTALLMMEAAIALLAFAAQTGS